jgi:secreted trypsin-like serine protease
MRLARPLAAFASLILLGCTDHPIVSAPQPETPSFIINGTPTGSDFGSVGALLFDYNADGTINGDDEWCTGSLIAPTVFLTAAHCIITPYTPPGTAFYVSFSGDLYSRGFKAIRATGYVADPAYGHDQADLHDLAVVFLPASATKGMKIYQLPAAGYLDQLAAQGALKDQVFVNVGYGTANTRTGVPGFPYDGVRKVSESTFLGLQPAWLGLNMNLSATDLGGDCYGDSGGPKFLKSNLNVIVATVTTGDYPCRATSWDYRTDTREARSFLGQFVSLP